MTNTQSAWSHQRQGRGEAPGKSARPRLRARRGAGSVEFV